MAMSKRGRSASETLCDRTTMLRKVSSYSKSASGLAAGDEAVAEVMILDSTFAMLAWLKQAPTSLGSRPSGSLLIREVEV